MTGRKSGGSRSAADSAMVAQMGIDMTNAPKRALVLASVFALGLLLAGCDKCGDWFGQPRGEQQSCKDTAPAPR
jgi:hypothetical protein